MMLAARIVGLVCVLALLLQLPAPARAQTSTKEATKKSAETSVDAFKDYTIEKKNEAVAHGKRLLRDADSKLKQLEAKAGKATGEVKAAQEVKDLKAKRAQAAQKLDEMGKASAASWDNVKQGFTDAYKDLQQGFEKAVAHFK
jgi:hypothetical protein